MLNHNLLFQNLGFSCYEFENMDLAPILEDLMKNKHKNMNLNASFRIKQGFYSRTHEYHSLSKTKL